MGDIPVIVRQPAEILALWDFANEMVVYFFDLLGREYCY